MKMKQLFRYTTSLLRTALLLGAVTFASVPMKAGTVVLPDAFDTMDPADIIGDGNYYYIQFYQSGRDKCSYLTDCGVNKRVRTRDFLPYANNRLWTLVPAGDGVAAHFKLRNKDGHYLSYGSYEYANRFGCEDNYAAATILTYHILDNGYDISEASDEANPMFRPSYNEWTDLAKTKKYTNSQSYNLDLFRLRFVKLKSNAAFIIEGKVLTIVILLLLLPATTSPIRVRAIRSLLLVLLRHLMCLPANLSFLQTNPFLHCRH